MTGALSPGASAPGETPLPAEPTPPDSRESGVAALVRSLLPTRSAEDILAGIVRLRFGAETVFMPVLAIRANRAWKEHFNSRVMGTLAALEEEVDAAGVLRFLMGMTDVQLELLRAYDHAGVLPSDEWLEEHATDSQLLSALLGCTAAAFPLVASLIELMRDMGDLQALIRDRLSRSTSTSPVNTDGSPASLKAN